MTIDQTTTIMITAVQIKLEDITLTGLIWSVADALPIGGQVAERVAAVDGPIRLDLRALFVALSLRCMAALDQYDEAPPAAVDASVRVPILAAIARVLGERGLGARVTELLAYVVCKRSLQAVFRAFPALSSLLVVASSDEFDSLDGVGAPALTALDWTVAINSVEVFSEEDAHSFRRLADPLIAVVRAAPALASVAVHSWVGVALGSVPYRVARHAPNLRSLSVMCPDGEGTFEFNLRIASREWRAFLAVCPPAIEHIAFHGLSSPLDTADMALLLRCAPQLRSLELLTEAAWPEAMTSTSRQERAHHPEEEEEEEEEDDEQPSSRRRLMLPAISEAEFRDCEALLAGRNSEPSTSLQRLAIVGAVHATVEQVLLPLIRGSGCGVESVRVWLCNTADSKRVVLEALAHNAGAVRDVVVPHNAVDDTLLRQLVRATALERFAAIKPALFAFDSAGVTVDEPERFDPQLLLDLLHACRAFASSCCTASSPPPRWCVPSASWRTCACLVGTKRSARPSAKPATCCATRRCSARCSTCGCTWRIAPNRRRLSTRSHRRRWRRAWCAVSFKGSRC